MKLSGETTTVLIILSALLLWWCLLDNPHEKRKPTPPDPNERIHFQVFKVDPIVKTKST